MKCEKSECDLMFTFLTSDQIVTSNFHVFQWNLMRYVKANMCEVERTFPV